MSGGAGDAATLEHLLRETLSERERDAPCGTAVVESLRAELACRALSPSSRKATLRLPCSRRSESSGRLLSCVARLPLAAGCNGRRLDE